MRLGNRISALTLAAAAMTAAGTAASSPMTFQVVEQRTTDAGLTASIYATGEIVDGTTRQFEELVASRRIDQAMVSFDSAGGLVVESVQLGQSIRRLGFGTSVQRAVTLGGVTGRAQCASACVYAYVGGVARYLDDGAGRLGVHQYYGSTTKTPESAKDDLKVAQLMGSVIVAHLTQMGVSSALYVAAAMTDSGDMLWLGRKDAEAFDLVNNGELAPKAEIRLTDDGHPYLVISQIADRGRTTIAISCEGRAVTLTGAATGDGEALQRVRSQAIRSQFEINGATLETMGGGDVGDFGGKGIETTGRIDATALGRMDKAGTLGFSIDDLSGKWRRQIDVHALRDKIAYYTRTCHPRG